MVKIRSHGLSITSPLPCPMGNRRFTIVPNCVRKHSCTLYSLTRPDTAWEIKRGIVGLSCSSKHVGVTINFLTLNCCWKISKLKNPNTIFSPNPTYSSHTHYCYATKIKYLHLNLSYIILWWEPFVCEVISEILLWSACNCSFIIALIWINTHVCYSLTYNWVK